jgi:hypothetical protein
MKNGNILLGAVIMPLKGNELKKNEKVFLSLIASDQRSMSALLVALFKQVELLQRFAWLMF